MIYICIPTHNEQQTVGVVLWKLRQVLTDFPRDYQLLVADDASTDKTPEVLEPYTRVLPLTVIRSDRRQGYAASLEMLMREAVRRSEYPKRDVVVALQADFSDEPDDLVALVKRLEAGADVAVGNKVSTARETRTRRLSRSLARMFARRQKWPEGVQTPFDGYRAYRLYSVKRAMEDRAGKRLVCYDGWAGHAELLRAVLPHARRVDVVDVDDRPDRLQRPRREKPFAAAMQVRAMAAGTEPPGLVGVEELDRIAATTSRSRERSAAVAIPTQNGRDRSNGSRARTGRGETRPQGRARKAGAERRPERPSRGSSERGERSSRGAGAERGERPKRGSPERSSERSNRGSAAERSDRPARNAASARGSERAPRQRTGPAGERSASDRPRGEHQPAEPRDQGVRPEGAGGTEGVELTDLIEELPQLTNAAGAMAAGAVEGGDARPKRRRRRRRRSGAKGGGESGSVASEGEVDSEATDDSGVAEAEESDGPQDGTPKKRRRRGGRRGGRGRRRPQVEGAPEGSPDGAEIVAGTGAGGEPEGGARVEID